MPQAHRLRPSLHWRCDSPEDYLGHRQTVGGSRMSASKIHRVAILGLMLESNRFAPVITEEDYLKRVYLAGDEILEDLHLSLIHI
jgi:hypothetical protein